MVSYIRPQTFRQLLILSGLICCGFTEGFIFGHMSGTFADLQKREGPIILSDNYISWIAGTMNVMCTGGILLTTLLSAVLGRRMTVSCLNTPMILCWTMVYYCESTLIFLITRIVAGISFGGVLLFTFVVTAEYTSPQVRALFTFIVSAVAASIGLASGHILCILLHWRTAALIGIIPAAIAAITPYFCVESPVWLASKGKYQECEESFRSLHGHRQEVEKELLDLIELEKKRNRQNDFKMFLAAMKHRYFWNMFTIYSIIGIYRIAACRIFFATYAITILQDITGRSDILLFTMLVDSCNILGSCLSCILISKMKMRSLLFSLGVTANVLLIILSVCLHFQHVETTYLPWINSTLLGLHFILVNAGPYPVLEAMIGELMPSDIKFYMFLCVSGINSLLCCFSMKLIPDVVNALNYSGTFFLHAVVTAVCLLYFWKYLPETKGKTLQEIELRAKNLNTLKIDEVKKQTRSLI